MMTCSVPTTWWTPPQQQPPQTVWAEIHLAVWGVGKRRAWQKIEGKVPSRFHPLILAWILSIWHIGRDVFRHVKCSNLLQVIEVKKCSSILFVSFYFFSVLHIQISSSPSSTSSSSSIASLSPTWSCFSSLLTALLSWKKRSRITE